MRVTSPAIVLARCCSRRIWRLRLENSDSITRRMRALAISVAGRLPSWWRSGGDQSDADEVHRGVELFAPQALVGEQDAAAVRTGEIERALAFLAGLGPTRS